MRVLLILAVLLAGFSGPLSAQEVTGRVMAVASELFLKMPKLRYVPQIDGTCGAGVGVNDRAVYCTTSNEILVAQDVSGQDVTPYLVAHLLGHAVQVRHGVADIALRTIRANRADEVALRAHVARQVDCVAGYIYQAAGLPVADVTRWLVDDPFADVHWGRDPLSAGPVMGIGLSERNAWFQRGQAGDLARCASGPFGSELLLIALNR